MKKTKKLIWTKDIPVDEGWYWIQYKGKYGKVICPASLMKWGNEYIISTARNDNFTNNTVDLFGWYRIGPRIDFPNVSLKAKI